MAPVRMYTIRYGAKCPLLGVCRPTSCLPLTSVSRHLGAVAVWRTRSRTRRDLLDEVRSTSGAGGAAKPNEAGRSQQQVFQHRYPVVDRPYDRLVGVAGRIWATGANAPGMM
jgi:hypothetical protein